MEPKQFEPVIGLEVHAELQTRSKMFCSCRVVDTTVTKPNTSVCQVCIGMPGVLPVTNKRAVEFGLRVALALECDINLKSEFARKNYFYPDLPKGYQISQYEQPLGLDGRISISTQDGDRTIRIRRVHLEEDTGKLTHSDGATLIDLNRAGVPLLEIVSEPEIHSAKDAREFANTLRSILMYLGVNSGEMEKGVLRIEPNVSVRKRGSADLGTRTEIKNLNSLRALERGLKFEISRQSQILKTGGSVIQETVGWDEDLQKTYSQRVKEEEEDYRYFPEPDLPDLVINPDWLEEIRAHQPELPTAKLKRFLDQFGLLKYTAEILTAESEVADYFEAVVESAPAIQPNQIANWITGELFRLLNETGMKIQNIKISPSSFGKLLCLIEDGAINISTGKSILATMFEQGKSPDEIIQAHGLRQITDHDQITKVAEKILKENLDSVSDYLNGKDGLFHWFFGQIMRETKGKANPEAIKQELHLQLSKYQDRKNT